MLGHVDYYPRHGFVPAPALGIRWEKGHDEAFFVQALTPGGLDGASGRQNPQVARRVLPTLMVTTQLAPPEKLPA